MKAKLLKSAPEIGVVAGLGSVVWGLFLVYHPLGPIAGGLLLSAGCFFVVYDRMRRSGGR